MGDQIKLGEQKVISMAELGQLSLLKWVGTPEFKILRLKKLMVLSNGAF